MISIRKNVNIDLYWDIKADFFQTWYDDRDY